MPQSEYTNNDHEQISAPTYPYKTASGSTVLNMYKFSAVEKGKVFPYSLPSFGPGADPDVQAVSLQVT